MDTTSLVASIYTGKSMPRISLRANIILLITAAIWGFAFVAQRVGMNHVGPFTFNAVRFALGAVCLIPALLWLNRAKTLSVICDDFLSAWKGGALIGCLLFCGASLQQIGMIHTTAGNAGFITGLYAVLVPLVGLVWRQKIGRNAWAGVALATIGMYLLSVTAELTMSRGDLLVLIGAVFWAFHVQGIGHFTQKIEPLELAIWQSLICAGLSAVVALLTEPLALSNLTAATVPILYAGILSVGVAYTMQVIGQREAHPTLAAIIMSLESVFAALGGWLLLDETLTLRGLIGCALMLAGMIVAQIPPDFLKRDSNSGGKSV